jgi:hypothetical protein
VCNAVVFVVFVPTARIDPNAHLRTQAQATHTLHTPCTLAVHCSH